MVWAKSMRKMENSWVMWMCDQSSFLGGVCVANPGQTPRPKIPLLNQIDQRDWQSDKQTNKLTRIHNIWIRSNWKQFRIVPRFCGKCHNWGTAAVDISRSNFRWSPVLYPYDRWSAGPIWVSAWPLIHRRAATNVITKESWPGVASA